MKKITFSKCKYALLILCIFSSTISFAQYCSSNGNNTNDEYIGRVQLNTIDNSTGVGATSTGYSDYTAISTNLNTSTTYTITVTPTWTGTIYSEGHAVWIDYNQDDDFADAGELVWSLAATTATPVSGSFTVPVTALSGNTRMRVSMKYNATPTECESFSYGEVEDYTVNIVAPASPEINIIGNGTNIVDGDTTPIAGDDTEFGTIGTLTTLDHTFTIQNLGTGTLNLTGGTPIVDISGNAAFSILTQPSANSITSGGGDLTFKGKKTKFSFFIYELYSLHLQFFMKQLLFMQTMKVEK